MRLLCDTILELRYFQQFWAYWYLALLWYMYHMSKWNIEISVILCVFLKATLDEVFHLDPAIYHSMNRSNVL